MTVAAPVISTRKLTKVYFDRVAVDSLDLKVERGEIFGLLGPNGAGKTTTILMLLGLTEPTEGTVSVVGLDPTREALEVKRRVGYVPDQVGFYDNLTGWENLAYTARLNRIPPDEAEERIERVLAEVGLSDRADDKVGGYSRGMRQRLGIADALMKDPEVLILDEPTMAIDPAGVEEILGLIRRLPQERGVTVLLSSHLLGQVQSTCDRIGIFSAGRMVACGTIEQLARKGGGVTIEVKVVGGDPRQVLEGIRGVDEVHTQDGMFVVSARSDVTEQVSRSLAEAGLVITHLRSREATLEEIYRRYFRHEEEGPHAESEAHS